jgi:hypothetical protein
MPYKNPSDKKAHNIAYKAKNKWSLYLARIIKTNQKSVSQDTYDNIKDIAPKELLDSLKIRNTLKQSLEVTIAEYVPPVAEPVQKTRKESITDKRYPVSLVMEWMNTNIDDSFHIEDSKDQYQSKLRTMVKVFGGEGSTDVIVLFTPKVLKEIIAYYTNPTTYLGILLKISKNKEVERRISKIGMKTLIQSNFTQLEKAAATNVKKKRERDRVTNWNDEYTKMMNVPLKNEREELVHLLYTKAILDKTGKLRIIPRNYWSNTKIITSSQENDGINNFYNRKTGEIIVNDFKTKKKYPIIRYLVKDTVKKEINKNIDERPERTQKEKLEKRYLLYNYSNRTGLRNLIAKTLNITGVDVYRTIMKHHYEKTYEMEYVALMMSHTVATGEAYYPSS